MSLSSNQLTKQVDLPVWEWLRPAPLAPTAGLSCTCNADNQDFNSNTARYIYFLINATNFWRYDTVSDTYLQSASPGITPSTASSMRFAGANGYYGRVISSTSNTIQTGLPNTSAVGYRIRIVSGRGSGQERTITAVSDPVVADFGGASAGAATSLTDSAKNWGSIGSTNNLNSWIGYVVRIVGGTGINQVRKILYNSATVLTIADFNLYAYDAWAVPLSPTAGTAGWTAPAAGSQYQIESSIITVDTAWDVQPDNTSRYVIQSGGIYLASAVPVANGSVSLQYYSILEDIWYAKSTVSNLIPTLPTDLSLERFTENSAIWYTGDVASGSTTTLTDSTAYWRTNQWAGYYVYIWTGTGRGQLAQITSNTQNVLTFPTLGTGLNSTSKYNIVGYDCGTLSSATGRIVTDSTKNWDVNRWANYAIRILAGTGRGQIRQILSNGSDSLVLYEPWNVQPDNTSIYTILPNTQDMFFCIGGNSQTFLYRSGDTEMPAHGRILDEGIIQVACAMLTDGTSTATHEIYEQKPVAITSLSGTTTITATTVQPHQFKVGQWVSIRGVTSAAADVYNITGKVQILSVPTNTTFTYTPFAAGTGTYQYSNNVTIGVSVLPDASKYHADLATGGSTTSVTFSRAAPSNINGWYVYGTNIAAGAQVVSGAGTTTLTLNLTGAGTPTGTITITKLPQPVTATYSSGGGAGVFNLTTSGSIPNYVKGWLATGTNIGIGAIVTGGEGTTTPAFSIQCAGAPSGTITFSHPVNNLLPVAATYSSGSGTTITLSGNVPSYLNGWFVSGANIANGTTVVSGAGTATITLSASTTGTPSGTITFYAPSAVPVMYYGTSAAPTLGATTGLTVAGNPIQLVAPNTSNGTIMTPLAAISAVAAGVSRYIITRRDAIGQQIAGQNISYLGGVSLGSQTVSTLTDTNSFWSTATGSGGSAGATSFTISAIGSPIHNGWFVSGTGIAAGTRVVSGGGTTTITVDIPLTGAVSGTVTFTAWSANLLVGRRLRVLSSTGANQDIAISSVTPSTGTITTGAMTASASGSSSYTILPGILPGTGTTIQWASDSSTAANRGRNLFRFRGGAAVGVDKIDLTTDRLAPLYTIPITETLTSGSMYAYDGLDRIYFTKDVTNRIYYLDLTNNTIQGAGLAPYLSGTAGVGNRMEIFKTIDGLKYIWINRHAAVEVFRQLLFY